MTKVSNGKIVLEGREIAYDIRSGRRIRRLTVSIRRGGVMTVTKPDYLAQSRVEVFLRQKSGWIVKKINELVQKRQNFLWVGGKKEYLANKNRALEMATEKIKSFNKYYNFYVGKIGIRDQKSRWGSCSRKGNLNFNYRIVFLPDRLVDYIVAHELCHLGQMNHSRNFWNLVKATLPDYAARRKELRKNYS